MYGNKKYFKNKKSKLQYITKIIWIQEPVSNTFRQHNRKGNGYACHKRVHYTMIPRSPAARWLVGTPRGHTICLCVFLKRLLAVVRLRPSHPLLTRSDAAA